MTGHIPRWLARPQTVTHPSTSPAVHDILLFLCESGFET